VTKYLLLALLVAVAWWVLRSRRRPTLHKRAAPPEVRRDEAMLACAHCGLNLPRSESLVGPDGIFCSEAHRLAAAEKPAAP
jgi:uncharacterized protein